MNPVALLPPVPAGSIEALIRGFVPTRRFAGVSFDSYQPDPRFPSQRAARERLSEFAARLGRARRADLLGRLIGKSAAEQRAVYLDGGYGVGKTHLLAATYHALGDQRRHALGDQRHHALGDRRHDRADGDQRRYLSFGELAYTISRLGLEPTLEAMASTRLLCIDEFELDDVAQTRMAAMFLHRLLERRRQPISLVTTSHTLPSDLGRGRFPAEAFQRDIGGIAPSFGVYR